MTTGVSFLDVLWNREQGFRGREGPARGGGGGGGGGGTFSKIIMANSDTCTCLGFKTFSFGVSTLLPIPLSFYTI